jgi:hypothetical protein
MLKFAGARSCALLVVLAFASAAFGASDPSMQQVYDAAQSGHLDRAQQMMDQVLRDHPSSGKAHYVQAELYAKEHRFDLARHELADAERLSPGLSFATPAAVRALREELSRPTAAHGVLGSAPARSTFPWGLVLLVGAAIAIFWMLLRRRTSPAPYSQYASSGMPTAGMASTAPGGATVMQPMGGGMGSGIASGLASGLAVGAGVVAGEEIARHFLDSDSRPRNVTEELPERADDPSDINRDMGGNDFGVQDASSWDDGGLGDSSGGDDWT